MGKRPIITFCNVGNGHLAEFGEAVQVGVGAAAEVIGRERNGANEPGGCNREACAHQAGSAQGAHIQGPKYCLQHLRREGLECAKAAREHQDVSITLHILLMWALQVSDIHVRPADIFHTLFGKNTFLQPSRLEEVAPSEI
jgi:hypothetical protein